MGTRKPLKEMITEIVTHFNNHVDHLDFNYRIYKVMEGQLNQEVRESICREVTSVEAQKRICERIPPINTLRKSTDKLSKVYAEKPTRLTNVKDQVILDEIQRTSNIDTVCMSSNKFYNSQHLFAIEPYIKNKKLKLRVLAGHQFLPYSDDIIDPTNMTVMIKLMGKDRVTIGAEFDRNGNKIRDQHVKEVNILGLYSDKEFLIIDSAGNIKTELMQAMGLTSTEHKLGVIPFIYKSRNPNQLIPFTNKEGFDMAVLFPKLIADLNYSSQFMCRSLIWTKNAEIKGAEFNPDTWVDLGGGDPDTGNDPEIGVITPTVDIANQLKLAAFQAEWHFNSIGIKTQVKMQSGEEASGVAKAIDEGDVTLEKKSQTEFFRCVEKELWELIKIVHDKWAKDNLLDENRRFSDSFVKDFRVQFSEMRPGKSESQQINDLKGMKELGIVSPKQMLMALRPDFSDEQADNWLKDVEDHNKKKMEEMMMGLPNLDSNQGDDGKFKPGNSAAQNDPSKRLDAEEKKLNE